MLKAMLFGDGGWLHLNLASHDPGALDVARLAGVVIDEIAHHGHLGPIDLVRAHWYGSCPENCDPADEEAARGRRSFLAGLAAVPGIDVRRFPIDVHGRRLRRADRSWQGEGDGGEAIVAVALGTALMRHAMTPGNLDLAIVVVGHPAYVPVLQEVRRLGKRVALVGLARASAPDLVERSGPVDVRDFDVIWLDQLLGRLERWRGPRPPSHPGGEPPEPVEPPPGGELRGRVKNVIWDRGYGFIAAEDGRDYFFHANALQDGLEFDELQPDLAVLIEVKSGPSRGRAGAARSVRPDPEGASPDQDEGDEDEVAATATDDGTGAAADEPAAPEPSPLADDRDAG